MEPEVRTVKKCLTTQILTAANREVVRYMGSPTYDVLLPEKCSLGVVHYVLVYIAMSDTLEMRK